MFPEAFDHMAGQDKLEILNSHGIYDFDMPELSPHTGNGRRHETIFYNDVNPFTLAYATPDVFVFDGRLTEL